MELCRFCSSNTVIKSGFVRKKQRYRCNDCGKHFIVGLSSRGVPAQVKIQALLLIKEGLGFRSTARILQVSLTAVLNWLKSNDQTNCGSTNNPRYQRNRRGGNWWNVALHSKKRRKIWIWFAIARATRRVIAFEIGSRGKKTLKRLLVKLSIYKIRLFCTDHWKIYRALIPAEKLLQSQKETCIVESLNCNVSHYLARFSRRSRCYFKSPLMVEFTCYLLFENHLTIC